MSVMRAGRVVRRVAALESARPVECNVKVPQLQLQLRPGWREWEHRYTAALFSCTRSVNIFSAFSKESLEKERERITDEMNRGYFDDVKDMKRHGGKVIATSKGLNAPAKAFTFPKLMVYSANQDTSFLPLSKSQGARATLVCMSFRASTQNMVDSWCIPLREAFPSNTDVQIYEVSWVESGVLTLPPVRKLLLLLIRASKASEKQDRKIVYAFGDSYDIRKALNITNRLTGYMYLLDGEGRVRWRSSGMATIEEASSLVSCTSRLLEESQQKSQHHSDHTVGEN